MLECRDVQLCSVLCLPAAIAQQLGSRQVEAVAFVLHNSQSTIHISGKDEAVCLYYLKPLILLLLTTVFIVVSPVIF